jgi:type II secretory pathway component PulF
MLGLLVQHRVPLPEALRLAADGSRDANVAQVSRRLAEGAENGRGLSEMLARTYRLPASLVPILRWGESANELAEALLSGSEMLEGRVHLRANLLRIVLPPFALLVIATGIGLLVAALLLPMIWMLNAFGGLI